MPKKKTKISTRKQALKAKKKTAVKKKRVSSRLKKKVVKKKKVTPKKTAKKKVSKKTKKSEVVQEVIKDLKSHADGLHNKQIYSFTSTKKQQEPAKKTFVSRFSFPNALNQVRDTVEDKDEFISSHHVDPAIESKEGWNNFEIEQKEVEHSPYLLDLKRGVTIFNHSNLAKSKCDPEPKQEVLSLFEEKPNWDLIGDLKHSIRTIRNSLKPVKTINLAPIENKFEPGRTAWRTWARMKWRWRSGFIKSFVDKQIYAYKSWKLQKAIQLPKSFGAIQNNPTISRITRGGEAIQTKDIQAMLKHRKGREVEEEGKMETFSEWLHGKKARPVKPLAFSLSWTRSLVPFAALGLVLMLPFLGASVFDSLKIAQGEVLGATEGAVHQLQEAKLKAKQLDFIKAAEIFEEAGQGFLAAGALLENNYGTTAKLLSFVPVVGDKIDAAESLLNAGNSLSESATLISQGLAVFTNEEHFLAEQPMSYKLEYLFVRLQEARLPMTEAAANLSSVDVEDLPEDMRYEIGTLQQELPGMITYLNQMDTMTEALLGFLGHDAMQRYLILFQNDTELRATGGFMGSLALVDVDRAEIERIEIPGGGPYDFQGSLFEYYQAPRALRLINPRWELQDANWFFDWPLSAEKISNFYEKAGGPSVDGLIAINTKVLESLLEFTGPILIEPHDVEINAENFREVLQSNVEFEYDQELNQPKKIIADLAPILFERIKNLQPDEYIPLAQNLSSLLQEREIFIYHQDQEIFNTFSELGWTGEVVDSDTDYLGVVHTNLAGGKTDGVIQDKFDLTVHVNEKGETLNTLLIERTHTGEKGVPLVGVRNVDYLRVFVPKGSELIASSGFEQPPLELFEEPEEGWLIDEDLALSEAQFEVHESGTEIFTESNRTVFANWLQVDPGETIIVKLVYKTPVNMKTYSFPEKPDSWLDWFTGNSQTTPEKMRLYRLYWQKQSGSWTPEISITVNYPQDWQVKSDSNVESDSGPGSWNAQAAMKGDSIWSLLFY